MAYKAQSAATITANKKAKALRHQVRMTRQADNVWHQYHGTKKVRGTARKLRRLADRMPPRTIEEDQHI